MKLFFALQFRSFSSVLLIIVLLNFMHWHCCLMYIVMKIFGFRLFFELLMIWLMELYQQEQQMLNWEMRNGEKIMRQENGSECLIEGCN